MTAELVPSNDVQRIVQLVLDGLTSQNSKQAYGAALRDFLAWHEEQGRPALNKMVVQAYKAKLQAEGKALSTINLKLSAVRKLAQEAALANGVAKVKGVKTAGTRTGNWLTQEPAQRLLHAPDVQTLKGLRDRAILAVCSGVACVAPRSRPSRSSTSSSARAGG